MTDQPQTPDEPETAVSPPAPQAWADPATEVSAPTPPAEASPVEPAASPAGPPPVEPPAMAPKPAPAMLAAPPPPPFDEPSSADGSPLDNLAGLADERPEVAVGAAFAGGFVLAMILKRFAH